MRKKNKLTEKTLLQPCYKGKHIILIKGKIHTAENGKMAAALFDRLTKKYPGCVPTLAYVSKEDTLILCLL